jgi:hypothetical protein
VIRGNVADFVAADGTVRFLVYGERAADETFHDYVAVTVTTIDAPCPADLNGDGAVDGLDLGAQLGAWGACGGSACAADLNDDGVVDGLDLGSLLGAWGPCA